MITACFQFDTLLFLSLLRSTYFVGVEDVVEETPEQLARRLEEEAEERLKQMRATGTPVTVENFNEWMERFNAVRVERCRLNTHQVDDPALRDERARFVFFLQPSCESTYRALFQARWFQPARLILRRGEGAGAGQNPRRGCARRARRQGVG